MAMKTCCGLSLKVGALLIGYAYAVLSILGAVFCYILLLVNSIQSETVGPKVIPKENGNELISEGTSKLLAALGICSVKICAVSCFMIYGIWKTKPAYLFLWMVIYGAWIALHSLIITFGVTLPLVMDLGVAHFRMVILAAFVINVLEIYFFLIVSSYYHRIRKAEILFDEEMLL